MSLSDAEQKQLVKDFHVLDLDTEVVGRSRMEFFMEGAGALASMRPSAQGLEEALDDIICLAIGGRDMSQTKFRQMVTEKALSVANDALIKYRKGRA